jgi:uncharacterized membrane protein
MAQMIPWFRFLHILAALWLVGGLFAGPVVRAQIRRSAEPSQKALGARLLCRLCAVFVLPGLLLAGLLGFHLVGVLHYPFSMLWVKLSAAVWALMLLSVLFVVAPWARRCARAAAGAANDGGAQLDRLLAAKLGGILWDVNALGVVLLTLWMVLKPV